MVEIIERELRDSFAGDRQLFVWDGEGENPYHAFLALATLVVTTPDSISMTTEAIASAKPVFTVSVERAQVGWLCVQEVGLRVVEVSSRYVSCRASSVGSTSRFSTQSSPRRSPPPPSHSL